MKCPVCSSYSNQELDLRSDQFSEELLKCETCGCEWSVNHGLVDIVKDRQTGSFLEAGTESVESFDYNLATN